MERIRFSLALCTVLGGTTVAMAQTTNEVLPNPFFRVMTTIPDALPTTEGAADIGLSFFIDPAGEISSVSLMNVGGLRVSGACEPICFKVGNPPRTYCFVSAGCGGGGGGGTLSIEPVLIDFELAPDQKSNAKGVFEYVIKVITAGGEGPSTVHSSTVTLPTEQ